MKNNYFLFLQKTLFLFFVLSFFSLQEINAQCTNPEPTGAALQTFCATENSTIGSLSATGGTIVWFDAPTGGNQYDSATPLFNGVTYYADDISNNDCSATRLAVTVEIYGEVPTNVDVFVGKCASENPTIADLSATGSNIQWFDAQTGGNLLADTDNLVDGKTYWVQQTENGCVSERLPTTVSLINPEPPVVEAIQTFCFPPNPTVADLQAQGTNVVWYDSENSVLPLNPSTPLVNGEDYWAVETSFPCESTTRVQTTVQLEAAPNAGNDGSLTVCEIDATTTNLFDLLGGTPDITGTWTGPSALSNGYLGTFEPGINAVGTYTYTVTSASGVCSDDSADVTVTINTIQPPVPSNANQVFCAIDNPQISDLTITGNGIIWYDSETSTTPLNTADLLIDGEDYWASQTDSNTGCESLGRVAVTVTITAPPPPTTNQANQVFCEIDNPTVQDLIATGTNIVWYASETDTTPLSETDLLIDGEDYWASQTDTDNTCESASRLVVTATINSTLPPTTTSGTQTFCEIENATIADLSISGDGIVWYDTETSSTPLNTTDLLVDGEDYWASQTDASTGCESESRLVITAVVNSTPPPSSSGSTQLFCAPDFLLGGPTVADLEGVGNNVVWYASETSTTPLNPSDLLVEGQEYWAAQTDVTTGCESAARLYALVNIIDPITPTTSQVNQVFCEADNPTISNLSATGDNIVWFASETSTTPLNATELLVDGEDYWAAEVNETSGCESVARLMVNVTLNTTAPVTISNSSQEFCVVDNPKVFDLTVTGTDIVWYDSETSTTPLDPNDLLVNGEDYWAVQTDPATGCESIQREVVNAVLIDLETPDIILGGNEFCVIDNPTLANLNVNVSAVEGGQINWYTSYPGGTLLTLNEPLVEGATYYATEFDPDRCESSVALEVTVSLEACDQYDIDLYDGFSPTGNGINDTFTVGKLRELYPNYKIEFFNRWGTKVYTANASKPDWNGRLNGTGELVPAGVYYYIIYFNKNNRKPIQKRLYLSR